MEFLHDADLNEQVKVKQALRPPEEIRDEINKFEYKSINISIGSRHPDTYKLGEVIPPINARHILIVTKARSGSSFLGDMLSAIPGTFYSYEPLLFKSPDNINLLKEVFTCYQNKEYFEHAKNWSMGYSKNFRLMHLCKSLMANDKLCYTKELYYSTCEMFPIRLIKTIRMSMEEAENLLLDQELGKTLKIVFLVRDPRGKFQSLKSRVKWCDLWKGVCDMKKICQALQNDLTASYKLKEKYPG